MMKTNRRKQLIAVLLVLAVSLSTASCAAHKRGQLEVAIPPTVPVVTGEPAEPQMMAPVEGNEPSIPAESAPPATQSHATQTEPNSYPTEPPTTEPPVIPTEPPVEEQQPSIPAETVPPVIQPPTIPTEPPAIPTEPPSTEPPAIPTEPPATEPLAVPVEPPATEPIGCQHTWQSVQHPEEGHYVGYAVCKCGYRCNGANDWFSHRDSFCLEDALVYHTSYGVGEEYIVDSPAYTTWVCTKCEATSDTQP